MYGNSWCIIGLVFKLSAFMSWAVTKMVWMLKSSTENYGAIAGLEVIEISIKQQFQLVNMFKSL